MALLLAAHNTYVHERHAGLESSNLLQYGEFSPVLELEQFNVEFGLLRAPVQYKSANQCLSRVNDLCRVCSTRAEQSRYVLGVLGVLLISSGVLGRSGVSLSSGGLRRSSLSCAIAIVSTDWNCALAAMRAAIIDLIGRARPKLNNSIDSYLEQHCTFERQKYQFAFEVRCLFKVQGKTVGSTSSVEFSRFADFLRSCCLFCIIHPHIFKLNIVIIFRQYYLV